MPIPLIAGNWKMHKTEGEAISLVRTLMQRTRFYSRVDILICPPFTSLSQLHKLLINSEILLGAQDISNHPSGAYTGEISGRMVAEFCSHVILGHSERRTYFDEDDSLINSKVQSALESGLVPVLCVGESLAEREGGQAAAVISRQLRGALSGVTITEPATLVIAYEPVWAIGTGLSASPEDISEIISAVIRPVLAGQWGEEIAARIRILYGGSVNPGNAGGYLNQPEIDGALIGGASLSAEDFLAILDKTQ